MGKLARAGVAVSFLIPLLSAAQTQRPQQPGTISGQVLCADTQRPARLAQVELIRVPDPQDLARPVRNGPADNSAPTSQSTQTSLDGTYTLSRVKPGSYYVVADLPGYLIPLSEFSLKDLVEPDAPTKLRLNRTLQTISVAPGEILKEDIVLRRGASISGIVSYDDGSPAIGIPVQLLTRNSAGKWDTFNLHRYRSAFVSSQTDDSGRFRLTGLPEGNYALQADFSLDELERSSGPMPANPKVTVEFTMSKTLFALSLYSGNVLRKSDAKLYKLPPGAAQDAADLVLPIAKLHKVSGQVLAKDGHTINGGNVDVLYADDQSQLTEAPIAFDGSGFHLDFVPEGEYLLKVAGAKDVTHIQVANPAGYTPAFREEPRTVRTYSDFEQPLVVQGDLSNVVAADPNSAASANLSVPE